MTDVITWAIAITCPALALALLLVTAFHWPTGKGRGDV